MNYPNPCEIRVSENIHIEVDVKKDDCKREAPHCHVYISGMRRLQVWLDSVTFSSDPRPFLNKSDENSVLAAVSANKYKLIEAYNHNRIYGAGY